MISVKNHHMPPTILVDKALGISSEPAGLNLSLEVDRRTTANSKNPLWFKFTVHYFKEPGALRTTHPVLAKKKKNFSHTLLHKRSNSKPHAVD